MGQQAKAKQARRNGFAELEASNRRLQSTVHRLIAEGDEQLARIAALETERDQLRAQVDRANELASDLERQLHSAIETARTEDELAAQRAGMVLS